MLSSTIEHQGAAGTYPGIARPHDGTPEGARAAWAFILTSIRVAIPPAGFAGTEQQHRQDDVLRGLVETYRRELEAMK